MNVSRRLVLVSMALCAAAAWGQSAKREPQIGYLYPGGGQQGSVFLVTVGGQYLRGITDVHVSGEGVHGSLARYVGRFRPPSKEQRDELRRRMIATRDRRLAEMRGDSRLPEPPEDRPAGAGASPSDALQKDPASLPNHPLLHNLDDMSLRELAHVRHELLTFKKKQPNSQIAETALIEIAVDPGAAPGDRELRIETRAGLTNPMRFQVDQLPEVRELEPNGPNEETTLRKDPPFDLPVLLNGQIMPGDVDRFPFRARRGQQLVVETFAQRLVPYMADAVPGWFQATMSLFDAKGNEVAFMDDYRFNPDPVLFYTIPDDGEYALEIRDAIYRGREDFVYRIAVGEQPFITRTFPLGGRMGARTVASVAGWNLPGKKLPLDTRPGLDGIRHTSLRQGKWQSNPISYAVDTLPECNETEPNDTPIDAQRIRLPRIVNGRITQPGDVDVFQFEGRDGDEVVAEVIARTLNSPLDSLLRLTDASGAVLEWNDDSMHKDGHLHTDSGLLTHHADSCLHARLPNTGTYFVNLSDSQNHGGHAFTYRLRITPPRPDFALRATPSSLNVHAGLAATLSVHALRKDGFDGDIELALMDPPAGFALDGGRIPGGRDHVRMTLTAPRGPIDGPVALRLEGRARIGGEIVSRPVVPSEDMMQAFLYRHLAPSQELMVAITGPKRGGSAIELDGRDPIRIPEGGTAEVRIKAPKRSMLSRLQLELSEPPEGVTLQNVSVVPGGLALVLKSDDDAAKAGFADNLIVEVFAEFAGRKQGGDAPKQKRRIFLGVLPAIPFEIVQRQGTTEGFGAHAKATETPI